MTHEKIVLVGIDGSPASMKALNWAIQEAARLSWRIHIVCSYALPAFTAASLDGGYAALDDDAIQAGAKAVLSEATEKAEAKGLTVSSSIEVGDPASVLIELSESAGLAVVGTKGKGGFAERLLGTVSSALPAHGHCPTVVVPLHTGIQDEEKDAVPVDQVRRIVVGVDGSEAAEVALDRAIGEAIAWNAELTAFSAVPTVAGVGMLAWTPGAADHEEMLNDIERGIDSLIEKVLAKRSVPQGFRIKRHALDGTAASLIIEFSSAVDLVVVGSRGRGGFSGLLLGSTSQAVLHHAVCPIMVVPVRVRDEGIPPAALGTGMPWQS